MNQPVPPLATGAAPEKDVVPGYAWVILAVAFLASVAAPLNQFKVSPVMPVLMQAFDLSLSSAGMLMSVFAITGFILALPAGLILQRLGLKPTGLLAMGCLVIGSILGGLSPSAGLMLFSRVVEGVGMGLIAVVAPAAIAMWFPPHKQGAPMGLWATWVPVGAILMFVLAPAMADAFGWQSIWWFGAGFAALAFGLVLVFMRMPPALETSRPDGSPPEAPDMRPALSNRNMWLLAVLFGLFNLGTMPMSTYYPTFLSTVRNYDMASASFVVSLTMVTVLFSAPLAGVLLDKLGSRRALLTWPFLALAVLMLLPFTVTGALIPLLMVAIGLISGAIPTATFSAMPGIMQKPELAGLGMGAVSLGQNLGMFLGPILFGALAERAGWTAAGLAMIPILLAGLAIGRVVRVQ